MPEGQNIFALSEIFGPSEWNSGLYVMLDGCNADAARHGDTNSNICMCEHE